MLTESRDDICDRLLNRVAAGDRDALGEIYQREAPRLIAVARRMLRRRELAEEAVHDGFVAAWRNARKFDSARGRARAWLTTIVKNRALNMVRDGARLDLVADDTILEFSDRSGEAERAFRALADADALKACLEGIEEQRRTAILLAYVVGYSHGEIAAGLKVPIGTVKAWIRRGVIALQECLS